MIGVWIWLGLACMSFIAMLLSALHAWWLLRTGVRTDAEITEVKTDSSGAQTPVISFTPEGYPVTADGRTHVKDASNVSGGEKWHVGQVVPIIYHRGAPETARIIHWSRQWGAAIAFGVATPVLLVVAGLFASNERVDAEGAAREQAAQAFVALAAKGDMEAAREAAMPDADVDEGYLSREVKGKSCRFGTAGGGEDGLCMQCRLRPGDGYLELMMVKHSGRWRVQRARASISECVDLLDD